MEIYSDFSFSKKMEKKCIISAAVQKKKCGEVEIKNLAKKEGFFIIT